MDMIFRVFLPEAESKTNGIFREGCLNLLVGPQNTGKTSLIIRGIKAGGFSNGLILCGTEHARWRFGHTFAIPTSEEFDDLESTDISDGGIVVIYDLIYDKEQWPRIAIWLEDWRQRQITVVVATIWMWWLETPLLRAVFGESRIFVFRTPMAHNRRRLFEMFGHHQFPTQESFNTYMDETGQAPLWYGAFDLSMTVAKGDGV
jgi:hypothetical protein